MTRPLNRIIEYSLILYLIGTIFVTFKEHREQFSHLYIFSQFPKANRLLVMHGSDLDIYKYLNTESKSDSSILAIIPNYTYGTKINYFLYPRHITFITNPNEINSINLGDYSYIYLYYPIFQYVGYFKDGTTVAQTPEWSISNVYQKLLEANLIPPTQTQEEFTTNLDTMKGNLVFAN